MSLALSNSDAETPEIDFGKNSPWARLAWVLRGIWPKKTAAHMATYTGLLTRSCESFLSRNSALNGEAVIALLRSEHGKEVLEAVMQDSGARWYAEFQLMWDEAQLEAKRQELQERRKALREKP